ncbi:Ig-like domain-containing protein, partial [Ideonella margarita]
MPRPGSADIHRHPPGTIAAVWGDVKILHADGTRSPPTVGAKLAPGDLILTSQNGIILFEDQRAPRQAKGVSLLTTIKAIDAGSPEAAPSTSNMPGDTLLPGLRVERVVENVSPLAMTWPGERADLADKTADTANDDGTRTPQPAVPDYSSIPEDASATGNVLVNDGSNGTSVTSFTIANQTLPAGSTLTIPGTGSITIAADGGYAFTPAPDFHGAVPQITYNTSGGTTATLDITVTPVNDAPVANDDTVTVTEGTPVSGNVLGNDTDTDGDTLTVMAVTVDRNGDGTPDTVTPGTPVTITTGGTPVGTLLVNPDGTFTFTPAPDYNGPVPPVTYTVTDGQGGTDTGTLTLVVSPVDDASELAADTNTVAEDTIATGNVLANDSDADDVLSVDSFSVAGLPGTFAAGTTATIAGVGTLVINSNGGYTFTPVADYNGTVPQVSYTTNTGSSSTLDINVTPLDDTPAASDDLATTPEDTPVTIDVLANDTDADTPTLTITAINGQPISVGSPVQLLDTAGLPLGTVSLTNDG